MTWEWLSTLEGGTVGGLVVVPGVSGGSVLLAATPAGGFASEDGRTWRPLSPEAGPALADAIAASPTFSRDGTLFVASRAGFYRSTDRGAQWRHLVDGEILAIAPSPAYADDGIIFLGTGQDGVIRSDDAGENWTGANAGLLDLTVLAIALSPRFTEDRTAFVGTAQGLYRSRNGARSWREVKLALVDTSVQVLAVSPRFSEDKLVLAGTVEHGLLRSADGGGRFSVVPDLAERGISAITISQSGHTILAAAGSEVLRSDDGGETWTALPEAPGLVLSLALLPTPDGDVPFAGLHRLGVARLEGDAWTPVNDGLRASLLTRLVPSPSFGTDQTVFALSLDEGVLVSRDGGRTWERSWPEDADSAIAALAVSPAFERDQTLLASTTERLYRSVDAGQTWQPLPLSDAPPLRVLMPLPGAGRQPGYVGVALGMPETDEPVAAGADGHPRLRLVPPDEAPPAWLPGHIVRSDDGGKTWRPLGRVGPDEPGWTREIGALVPSPTFGRDRTLLALGVEARTDGTATTLLWRSLDGGHNWEVWLEEDGSSLLLPSTLAIPPTFDRDGDVILALGGQVLTPAHNAWERRGGRRRPVWHAAIVDTTVASVTALALTPGDTAGKVVYAGTSAGPLLSRDGGRSFTLWADEYDGGGIVTLAATRGSAGERVVLAVGVGGTVWQRVDR